jgi:acetyl-CoA C-acetyltransferase
VNGSDIALGHPAGNTGCRITVFVIHEMAKRGLKRQGGLGQAMIS